MIATFKDDCGGFTTSGRKSGGRARELEPEVEPEDGTEWPPSHDHITDEELLLVDEQGTRFPQVESAPGEDAGKIVERKTKD